MVAFHAQQAVEKAFEPIIEEFDLGFIKTHSLEMLYNIIRNKMPIKPDPDQFIILDQLYIDPRYPGEMGLLPNGKPDLKESKRFYSFAIEIIEAAKNHVKNHRNLFSLSGSEHSS